MKRFAINASIAVGLGLGLILALLWLLGGDFLVIQALGPVPCTCPLCPGAKGPRTKGTGTGQVRPKPLVSLILGLKDPGLWPKPLVLCPRDKVDRGYRAQGPDSHSVYYVALSCTGVPTPCYTTVQAAVDAADDPDDVIKVAAGTYAGVSARAGVTQVVYISKTITIRGGYTTANWTASDPGTNRTTLDALGQGRVLYITGNISPTVEGLRITGGDAAGLGGMEGWLFDVGGGVYVITATATLSGNQIFSNTADAGGGLCLNHSNATLINNIIADNQANTAGSGLYIVSSFPRLLHTTVARNGSAGLTAGGGSGVYVTGIGSDYSTVAMTNTILVSHTVGITVTDGSTATLTATLWGSGAWANEDDWGGDGTVITGTINLRGDPAFVEPNIGDYHVDLTSAAIDNGVDAGVGDDIDGDPRPQGHGYDLGADETGLAVTKQASPDPVHAGAQLTYTICVTNTSGVTLTATITDVLPNHVTPTGVLTWTQQDITASGGIWTQQVVVTVEIGYAGPLTNVVRVTTGEGAAGVYTETALSLAPHLEVSKGADPDPVLAGTQLTYTIRVTNTGNVTLTATITDVLPGHVTPTGVLTWISPITAPGGVWRETVFVTVEAGYAGPLTNVVRVTTKEGATGVYTETALSLVPHLEVSKQAAPDPVEAGAQLTYTIRVTNTGNVTLTATITDVLPSHVTPTGVLTWTSPITAPGGVWTKTVFVTVEMSYLGPLTNVVRVTTEEGATGVYTTTTEVPVTPRLAVSKQVDPDLVLAGAQLTYTIYVTNTGNVDLNIDTILDSLPQEVTTGDPTMWTSVPIALGGVWTETIVATVNKDLEEQLIELINLVYVNAGGGLSCSCSAISMATIGYDIHLPVVLKNY